MVTHMRAFIHKARASWSYIYLSCNSRAPMPVEDIDFLLKNNDKDAYLFFVDSGARDKNVFPTSSEYEVTFTEPFYNVFGIELMDAMVPSTMYTIDMFNDVFKYHSVYFSADLSDEAYNQYLGACFQANPKVKNMVHNATATTRMVFLDKTVYYAQYAATGNIFTASSLEETDFSVVSYEVVTVPSSVYSKVDTIVGVDTNRYAIATTQGGTIYILDKTDSVVTYVSQYLELQQYFIEGFDETSGDMKIVIAPLIYVDADVFASLAAVELNASVGTSSKLTIKGVLFVMNNMYMQIERGNYDINTFASYLNSRMRKDVVFNVTYDENTNSWITSSSPFTVPSQDIPTIVKVTTEGLMEKQARYSFELSNIYARFFIDVKRTLCATELGFSTYTTYKGVEVRYKRFAWPGGENDIVTSLNGKLQPPGIVNLTGIRYILLRCPEIENHLYNSFSYSQKCPGIGLFKLGSVNQITNIRFDFVNFIKKPFHPIGKLTKLTFRFETTNGMLYDFKGVDHNMLISVKVYVPRLKEPKHKYILNPNYNPNFIEYMVERLRVEDEENDDEELDAKDVQDIVKEQNKWDYSSDEEYGSEDSEIDITRYDVAAQRGRRG